MHYYIDPEINCFSVVMCLNLGLNLLPEICGV
jgi:hypothetical protein